MTLRAEHVTFAYQHGDAVLCDVTLDLPPGSVTGLLGPNGSGKSTLLRCFNGSLRPQTGGVWLDGQALSTMSPRMVARQIAVVPQDTPADVPLSVSEVVMLGRYAHWDAWNAETPDDARIVNACLERLGIRDLANRPFGQLSGGERQRTVIARALAQQGRVLLMDEPNSHLDLPHQLDVYRLARTLADEGQTVLVICHDLLIAPLMVDEAVVLHRGHIVAKGPTCQTLTDELLRDVFATTVGIHWDDSRVSADFS